MFRLGIVGDLSNNTPSRLALVLDEALKNSDHIVQVGDLSGAYTEVQQRLGTGKLSIIPGNHDLNYDSLGQPRNWHKDVPGNARLVGLDNSADHFDTVVWTLLKQVEGDGPPRFIFAHKPISPIVLPDASESMHIMPEGGGAHPDAQKLQQWLKANPSLLCCGHFHGWTFMETAYGSVLVEGRGGAAPQLGYTLLYLTPEGWVIHPVAL